MGNSAEAAMLPSTSVTDRMDATRSGSRVERGDPLASRSWNWRAKVMPFVVTGGHLKYPLGASKAHDAEFAAGIGTVDPIPNEPKLTAPVAISVSAASMST
jgi:hypothetical protein